MTAAALLLPTLFALATPSVSDTSHGRWGAGRTQADLCASRKPSAAIEAFVVLPPVRAQGARVVRGDTVVTAAVCVVPPKSSATKIGSYHGELYFDSTAARVLRVEKLGGGLRVENTTLAGRVNFAGASPSGFAARSLLNVVLRVKKPGARPKLELKMLELNAIDGTSLMNRLVIAPTP